MRAAKVQASLRIRAVSPEPSLLAHTSSETRGTFRQKARSLAPLNGWACAVKICHDGMLEDTNSLDAAHFISAWRYKHFNPLAALSEPQHDKTNNMAYVPSDLPPSHLTNETKELHFRHTIAELFVHGYMMTDFNSTFKWQRNAPRFLKLYRAMVMFFVKNSYIVFVKQSNLLTTHF